MQKMVQMPRLQSIPLVRQDVGTRAIARRNFVLLPRLARLPSTSSVKRAEIFSASASVMNSLMDMLSFSASEL